ncbi:MAG TPA: S41 family peptidase [Candidatus Eisenbacteria bacterium]|jgi:hypothetical protein
MKLPHVLCLLVPVIAFPLGAAAQGVPPLGIPPDQPDGTVDAATRRVVVDTLVERIERLYVFPDKARATARALRRRWAAHEYDRITSAKEFADSLTSHAQAVTHDLHVRVGYRHEPFPPQGGEDPLPEPEMRRMREMARRTNYGFERVERLPGNVGYLDLRQFAGAPEGQATAVAAMNVLAHTDTLIIDLRRNGGGSPAMIATLLTYLLEPGDRLLFNTFYERQEDRTVQFWTLPFVPGPRLNGKPVYVLTSPRTFSAAEEFAYDIQTHKLGTLVGAVTGGGAHPGGMFCVHEHFSGVRPHRKGSEPSDQDQLGRRGRQARHCDPARRGAADGACGGAEEAHGVGEERSRSHRHAAARCMKPASTRRSPTRNSLGRPWAGGGRAEGPVGAGRTLQGPCQG